MFLWRNNMAWDSFHPPVQYIYISASIKFNLSFLCILPLRVLPSLYNFYWHLVCKCSKAHLSHQKGFNFLFNHTPVWIASLLPQPTMRGHYPRANGWLAFTLIQGGLSVSNCLPSPPTFGLDKRETAFRQVDIQFYCQTNVIFVSRGYDNDRRWTSVFLSLVMLPVSPFNTLTLVGAHLLDLPWHQLSVHYVKWVTRD